MQRQGLRAMILSQSFGIVALNCIGMQFATIVLLKMGAGAIAVGAINAVHLGSTTLQVLTMRTVQRRGKRWVMQFWLGSCALVASAAVFLPDVWARYGDTQPIIPIAFFICAAAMRHCCLGLSLTGWMPLLQDNTPEGERGQVVGRLRSISWFVMLVSMLVMGIFIGDDAPWPVIRIILIIGVVASIGRALCLTPVRENPPDASSESVLSMLREPFRDRKFRWLLLYTCSYGAAIGLADPFRVVFLSELGCPDWMLLAGPAMGYFGGMLSFRAWGLLSDRAGNRACFSISHVGMLVCLFAWLLVERGTAGLVIAAAAFFLAGFFDAGNAIAQTRYLLGAVPQSNQTGYMVTALMIGISTIGIAGLAGGLLLEATAGLTVSQGALVLNNYHALFVLSGLLFSLPHILRTRLQRGGDASSSEVITLVLRPLRTMLGALAMGAWPKRESPEDEDE
jgi:nitrate/nitrite transporter NarK